jgi:hypothetical protein
MPKGKKQMKIGWTYAEWDITARFPCRIFDTKAEAQVAYGKKNVVKVRQTVEEI